MCPVFDHSSPAAPALVGKNNSKLRQCPITVNVAEIFKGAIVAHPTAEIEGITHSLQSLALLSAV